MRMTDEELNRLYEGSKNEHLVLLGSELRQLISEIREWRRASLASTVLRVVAEKHSADPASDDLTVPLALELADLIGRLEALAEYAQERASAKKS